MSVVEMSPEDREYVRSQAGSLGSGLLGGWSNVAFGASLADTPPGLEAEVRAEVRRILRGDASPPEEGDATLFVLPSDTPVGYQADDNHDDTEHSEYEEALIKESRRERRSSFSGWRRDLWR